MKVFASLFLDEDVDVLLADLLRSRGFDVQTTQDASRKGCTDAEQLQFAAAGNRVFVTHNRVDFEKLASLYFEQQKTHAGIIVAHRKPVAALILRLLPVLNEFSAAEFTNQIVYL